MHKTPTIMQRHPRNTRLGSWFNNLISSPLFFDRRHCSIRK